MQKQFAHFFLFSPFRYFFLLTCAHVYAMIIYCEIWLLMPYSLHSFTIFFSSFYSCKIANLIASKQPTNEMDLMEKREKLIACQRASSKNEMFTSNLRLSICSTYSPSLWFFIAKNCKKKCPAINLRQLPSNTGWKVEWKACHQFYTCVFNQR